MFRKLGRATFPPACDTCHSGMYCPIHSAFLCRSCDVTLYAASLCSSCDHKIHVGEQNRCGADFDDDDDGGGDDVAEAASWLVLNPEKNDDGEGLQFKGDGNSCGELTQNGFCDVSFGDDVEMQHQQQVPFELGFEFDSSKSPYGSMSHNVSISSTDVNSVLESTISEVSVCDSNPAIGTRIDLSSGTHILMPSSHLTYREARVQRYREKKKTRKFEKKIRYASRKAYAEIRPRIKGRFAKRNNVEAEMDHVLSSALITEAEYSVLQSF